MADGETCKAGCGFFSSAQYRGYCSSCYKSREKTLQETLQRERGRKEDLELKLAVFQSRENVSPADEAMMTGVVMDLSAVESKIAETEAGLKELRQPADPSSLVPNDIAEALSRSIEEDTKPPCRRLSLADEETAGQIRDLVATFTSKSDEGIHYVQETNGTLFEYPQLSPPAFDALVRGQIIDDWNGDRATKDGTLSPLEGGVRLSVLMTLGDGNCLCHGASLLMYRVHDRMQALRGCIRRTLLPSEGDASSAWLLAELRERFDVERQRSDRLVGITETTAGELDRGWQEQLELIDTAHDARRRGGYLSEFHAFVLCHVLRRPVVLFGNDEARLSGLAGVFLPILWKDPALCATAPLLYLFSDNHFSALALTRTRNEHLVRVPLRTKSAPLPVRFLTDAEMKEEHTIVARWMADVASEPHPSTGLTQYTVSVTGGTSRPSNPETVPVVGELERKFMAIMHSYADERSIVVPGGAPS